MMNYLIMAYGTRRFHATFKRAPIICIVIRINPILSIDTYFFTISSNIALPSTLGLPKNLIPVGLRIKIFKTLLSSSILAK
jgi:hypothetical protein